MNPEPPTDPEAAAGPDGAVTPPAARDDPAASRRLPAGREEFYREITRRLALLDREIRALSQASRSGAGPPGPVLPQLEMVLRLRLEAARSLSPERWPAARREIVEMWSRCRAEFERQALRAGQSHAAAGRSREGEGPSR